jgi:hypothetical protein
MHPFRAGYRTPQPRQKLILVLSALAGSSSRAFTCGVQCPGPTYPPLPLEGMSSAMK